jgi:hypothetical protein
VYLFRMGVPEQDAALYDALRAHGLQVTLGAPYQTFDGSQSLSGHQVAVLVGTGNNDDMPLDGQQALLDWVRSGRGLVTLEWTVWAVGQRESVPHPSGAAACDLSAPRLPFEHPVPAAGERLDPEPGTACR